MRRATTIRTRSATQTPTAPKGKAANAGDENVLPELKSGDLLISPRGFRYSVKRLGKSSRRNTGYDEPKYKLQRLMITGNREWVKEELEQAGLRLIDTTQIKEG
jgi:hypothetical protein